jgi:hypothetical protein
VLFSTSQTISKSPSPQTGALQLPLRLSMLCPMPGSRATREIGHRTLSRPKRFYTPRQGRSPPIALLGPVLGPDPQGSGDSIPAIGLVWSACFIHCDCDSVCCGHLFSKACLYEIITTKRTSNGAVRSLVTTGREWWAHTAGEHKTLSLYRSLPTN